MRGAIKSQGVARCAVICFNLSRGRSECRWDKNAASLDIFSNIYLDGSNSTTSIYSVICTLISEKSEPRPRFSPNIQYSMPTAPLHSSTLVLKVIINRRPLVLAHALLLSIHLHNLLRARSFVGFLVVSDFDETRESERDTLLTICTILIPSLISRAEGQISSLNFPNMLRLEPDIRLVLSS